MSKNKYMVLWSDGWDEYDYSSCGSEDFTTKAEANEAALELLKKGETNVRVVQILADTKTSVELVEY